MLIRQFIWEKRAYMSEQSIALSSSNTYSAMYTLFYNLFNEVQSVDKIMERISHDFPNIINDKDGKNDFYYAIAKTQWECGFLEATYCAAIENIINQNLETSHRRRMTVQKRWS